MTVDTFHRQALSSVISEVLTPAQLRRARELAGAGTRSDELMRWMRFNMPVAAQQVEDILYPAD